MELALWLAQGSREAVVCLYPLTSQTVCIPQHIYIPNNYWFLSFYFRSTVRFASPLPLLHIFVCMSPPLSAKRGEAETKKARWGTEGREGRSIIGVEQSEKQRWRREQCLRLRLDGIATERTNFGRSFFFFFSKRVSHGRLHYRTTRSRTLILPVLFLQLRQRFVPTVKTG